MVQSIIPGRNRQAVARCCGRAGTDPTGRPVTTVHHHHGPLSWHPVIHHERQGPKFPRGAVCEKTDPQPSLGRKETPTAEMSAKTTLGRWDTLLPGSADLLETFLEPIDTTSSVDDLLLAGAGIKWMAVGADVDVEVASRAARDDLVAARTRDGGIRILRVTGVFHGRSPRTGAAVASEPSERPARKRGPGTGTPRTFLQGAACLTLTDACDKRHAHHRPARSHQYSTQHRTTQNDTGPKPSKQTRSASALMPASRVPMESARPPNCLPPTPAEANPGCPLRPVAHGWLRACRRFAPRQNVPRALDWQNAR